VYGVAFSPCGGTIAAGEGAPSGNRLGFFRLSSGGGKTHDEGVGTETGEVILFNKPGAEVTFQDLARVLDHDVSREADGAAPAHNSVGPVEWATDMGFCLHAVAWSSNGRMVACGSMDGSVAVWDAIAHRQLWRWKAHSAAVNDVRFDPLGISLLLASDDGTVSHWLLKGEEPALRNTIECDSRAVNCVDVSPDGDCVAFGTVDGYVWLWDIRRWQELTQVNLGSEVNAVAYNPTGTGLACGDGAGNVHLVTIDGVNVSPTILTTTVRDGMPTLDCPHCWENEPDDWPGARVNELRLGVEIDCPGGCGNRVWVNHYVAAPYHASATPERETDAVFALLALAYSRTLMAVEDALKHDWDNTSTEDQVGLSSVAHCLKAILSLASLSSEDRSRVDHALARIVELDQQPVSENTVHECGKELEKLHSIRQESMRKSFAVLHQFIGVDTILQYTLSLDLLLPSIRALPDQEDLLGVDWRLAECVRGLKAAGEHVASGEVTPEVLIGPVLGFWALLRASVPLDGVSGELTSGSG